MSNGNNSPKRAPGRFKTSPKSHGGGSGSSSGAPLVAPKTALEDPVAGRLLDEQQRHIRSLRRQRCFLFVGMGISSAIFLIILAAFVVKVLFCLDSVKLLKEGGWHSFSILGASLLIASAVPLSLSMKMVRMTDERELPSGAESDLKLPATELGQAIIDLLKALIAKAG